MSRSQKGNKDYKKIVGLKYNVSDARVLSLALIFFGWISLVSSISLSSSILDASKILAFVGLSLTFWGLF